LITKNLIGSSPRLKHLAAVNTEWWCMFFDEAASHRYCNREFDDEKILVQHQKAKHFKC